MTPPVNEVDVLRAAGHAVIVTDAAGIVVSWNQAAEALYGFTAAEAVGQMVASLTVPLVSAEDAAAIMRQLQSGSAWSGEFLVRRRDGTLFPAIVTDTPVLDDAGDLVAIVGISADLSNTRRAGIAALVEHTSDLVLLATAEGRIRYASSAVERFGWRRSEVEGQLPARFVHPDDLPAVARAIADVVAGRGLHRPVTFRSIHASGTWRWLEATPNTVEIGPDEVGIVVVARDVTERLVAEQQLHESQARLQAVLDASPVGIVAYDGHGICTTAAGRGIGAPHPPIGGDLVAAAERLGIPGVADAMARTLAGETFESEVEMDGLVTLLRHSPLRDPTGRVIGGVVVGVDVTDRRRAEEAIAASEARWRALLLHSADAAIVVDGNGVIASASPAVKKIFGYQPAELVGRAAWTFVHADDVSQAAGRVAALLETPRSHRAVELRVRAADGSWRWVEQSLTNLLDHPAVGGVVVNVHDVTDRRNALEALAESETRYRGIVETAQEGICTFDAEGRIDFANPRLAAMVGAGSAVELLGHPYDDLVHPTGPRPGDGGAGRVGQGEAVLATLTGAPLAVLVSTNPLPANGHRARTLAMIADISDRKRAEEALVWRALNDPLTELPNRTLFLDRLNHALAKSARNGHQTVAVAFLDLDHFKFVNDSAGHAAGDELLRQVGVRLLGAVRRGSTTVARVGGDEFAVLFEDLDSPEDAVLLSERLQAALAEPVQLGQARVFVTASIGVAVGPPGDAETLLANADAAMYKAKLRGRSRTELFDDELRRRAERRVQLHGELRAALDADQFELHYQPVVALDGSGVAGVEGLVRWRHPTRGLLKPEAFLSVAEDTGLMSHLGAWALERVVADAAGWVAGGLPMLVGINLSVRQLDGDGFVSSLRRAVDEAHLDPSHLVVEVTEGTLMENLEAMLRTLDELRNLGVRTALDDFGTGYSSLSYLNALPVDILKIDQSFITGLPQDGLAVTAAIVDLAAAVGIDAVAEGIESEAQRDALSSLGCPYGQGWLWTPAVPASVVPEVVARLGGPLDPPRLASALYRRDRSPQG